MRTTPGLDLFVSCFVEYSFLQSGLDENHLASALVPIGKSIEVIIKGQRNLLFIPLVKSLVNTHSDKYKKDWPKIYKATKIPFR